MTRVTTADLDRLEFQAVQSGDHSAVAEQLLDLANRVEADSEVCRAELFVRAGEQWEMAQDAERAARAYQRAIDDGGETIIDARALLAGALLELNRVDEAYAYLERLKAVGVRNLPTYIHVTETLMAHSDLENALAWATRGVECFQHQDVSPTCTTCCSNCCVSATASALTWDWTKTTWTSCSTHNPQRREPPQTPRRPATSPVSRCTAGRCVSAPSGRTGRVRLPRRKWPCVLSRTRRP